MESNRYFSAFSILLENGVILWSAILDQVAVGSKVKNCELFIGEYIYASLNGTVTSIFREEEESFGATSWTWANQKRDHYAADGSRKVAV